MTLDGKSEMRSYNLWIEDIEILEVTNVVIRRSLDSTKNGLFECKSAIMSHCIREMKEYCLQKDILDYMPIYLWNGSIGKFGIENN